MNSLNQGRFWEPINPWRHYTEPRSLRSGVLISCLGLWGCFQIISRMIRDLWDHTGNFVWITTGLNHHPLVIGFQLITLSYEQLALGNTPHYLITLIKLILHLIFTYRLPNWIKKKRIVTGVNQSYTVLRRNIMSLSKWLNITNIQDRMYHSHSMTALLMTALQATMLYSVGIWTSTVSIQYRHRPELDPYAE